MRLRNSPKPKNIINCMFKRDRGIDGNTLRRSLRTATLIFALLVLPLFCARLGVAAEHHEWRGLRLQVSSPQEAIASFGNPNADEVDQFREVATRFRWPTDLIDCVAIMLPPNNSRVRVLRFDGLTGYNAVSLVFRNNNLMIISVLPDRTSRIMAARLSTTYGIQFHPAFNQKAAGNILAAVRQTEEDVQPLDYPVNYKLIGVNAEHSFAIIANISNVPKFGGAAGKSAVLARGESISDSNNFPGEAFSLCFLSPSALSAIP